MFTAGGRIAPTRSVALAGVVFVTVPPSPLELSEPIGIVLIRFPGVVEVTFTPTVHDPGVTPTCGGTVPPANDNVVEPGTAVTVPPHVFETSGGFAILIPG